MDGRVVIGQGSGLASLDPFLAMMHDDVPPHIHFPMHQHRGVEIMTYGISGTLYHEDSLGNTGTVVAGGVERNLFGRGFYHSEAPVGGEAYRGFQLFILLKPEEQQIEPSFQLLEPGEVPQVLGEGHRVRVIAGELGGIRSPVVLRNPTLYLDVTLEPGASLSLPVPTAYNGLAYVITGQGRFGSAGAEASVHQRLVLGEGSTLPVTSTGQEPLRFILISGRPIHGGR